MSATGGNSKKSGSKILIAVISGVFSLLGVIITVIVAPIILDSFQGDDQEAQIITATPLPATNTIQATTTTPGPRDFPTPMDTPTFTPSPTPTAAAPVTPFAFSTLVLIPPIEPVIPQLFLIHSSGTFDVRGTFSADLDEGMETSGAAADFGWNLLTSTTRRLSPRNGATFRVMGSSQVTRNDCENATLSAALITANDPNYGNLPIGSWVCANTSDGRFSAFRIDNIDPSDNQRMTISYTTYE